MRKSASHAVHKSLRPPNRARFRRRQVPQDAGRGRGVSQIDNMQDAGGGQLIGARRAWTMLRSRAIPAGTYGPSASTCAT
ncbi:hypothetical protein BVI434_2240008 [Burkholderia vietnamiensis]|nr:hypothetical protein BVI434_2240008 [Burkholderia vietnamiensis]